MTHATGTGVMLTLRNADVARSCAPVLRYQLTTHLLYIYLHLTIKVINNYKKRGILW